MYKRTFSLISFFCLDLASNAEKYRTDPDAKPPFSYATIICLAMRANNNKVSLSNIYAWIRENFLFYKYADPAWQVCKKIFHHLLLFVQRATTIFLKYLTNEIFEFSSSSSFLRYININRPLLFSNRIQFDTICRWTNVSSSYRVRKTNQARVVSGN